MNGARIKGEIILAPFFGLPEFVEMGHIESGIWRDCRFRDGERDDE